MLSQKEYEKLLGDKDAIIKDLYEALELVFNWIGGDKDEDEITSFIDSVLAKARIE